MTETPEVEYLKTIDPYEPDEEDLDDADFCKHGVPFCDECEDCIMLEEVEYQHEQATACED